MFIYSWSRGVGSYLFAACYCENLICNLAIQPILKKKSVFWAEKRPLNLWYFERKQPQKRIYWWSLGIVQKQWPRGAKSAKKIANCWEVRRHSSSGVSDRQLVTRTFVLLTWRLLGEMASLSAPWYTGLNRTACKKISFPSLLFFIFGFWLNDILIQAFRFNLYVWETYLLPFSIPNSLLSIQTDCNFQPKIFRGKKV